MSRTQIRYTDLTPVGPYWDTTGTLSATGVVYASGGNSNNWNSVWTTVSSLSTSWGTGTGGDASVNALVHSNSGHWNTAYNELSGRPYTLIDTTSSIQPVRGNNTASGKYSAILAGGSNTIVDHTSLTNNILAYWAFDYSGANVSLSDSTGNGNTLTLTDGIVTKSTGGALFDAYGELTAGTTFNLNAFTCTAWIRFTHDNEYRVIAHEWDGSAGWVFYFGTNRTGTLICAVEANIYGVDSGVFVGDGNWHFVAMSYDPTTGTMNQYVDGSLVDSTSYGAGNLPSSTRNFQIGGDQPQSIHGFNGVLDEIGLWGRVLDPSEITILYNNGVGLPYAGYSNRATGEYSVIVGGVNNTTNNLPNTFILGSNITAVSANYTYVNNIVSQGIVAANGGDSNKWNSTDSTVSSLSARWNSTYSTVSSLSARWNSAYDELSGRPYTLVDATSSIQPVRGSNSVSCNYSLIGGGVNNSIYPLYLEGCILRDTSYSTIVGGSNNLIVADPDYGGGGGDSLFSFIGGGHGNGINTANVASVVGGCGNNIGYLSDGSVIVGGSLNGIACSYNAFIVAGYKNGVDDRNHCSGIVGGSCNCFCAENCNSIIGGGYCNIAQLANSAIVIAGGVCNSICDSNRCSTIGGGFKNSIFSYGVSVTIAGGACNHITGDTSYYSFIGGGYINNLYGAYSGILGGCCNTTTKDNTFILGSNITAPLSNYTYVNNISSQGIVAANGGDSNKWNSTYTTVSSLSSGWQTAYTDKTHTFTPAGGSVGDNVIIPTRGNNTACTDSCIINSIIAGGDSNTIQGSFVTIAGGENNQILVGEGTFIGGGSNHTANGAFNGVIVGGGDNILSGGYHNFIGAGDNNKIYTDGYDSNHGRSVIVGGQGNTICSPVECYSSSVIGGGDTNYIDAGYSFIGGGYNNYIYGDGDSKVIAGGNNNYIAQSQSVFIGGGECNRSNNSNNFSSIVGGCCNILDNYSVLTTIVGGEANLITCTNYSSIITGLSNRIGIGNSPYPSSYANILGGCCNTTTKDNTFILGSNITAPLSNYTYVNNISSQGIVAANDGDSNKWNSAYTTTNTCSSKWDNSYTLGNACSSKWDTSYTLGNACSSKWDNSYTLGNACSSKWDTSYTTTNTCSANWNTAYNELSGRPYTLIDSTDSIQPIRGGSNNSGYRSVIGGGQYNCIPSLGAVNVIVGGDHNYAGGIGYPDSGISFVGGGQYNCVIGSTSVIVGGTFNTTCGDNYNFIGGGTFNITCGVAPVIVGGTFNYATGDYSAILGGSNNDTKYKNNTFIVGSNLSASTPNYTYVNNISSQGIVAANGGDSNKWNNTYSTVSSLSVNWGTPPLSTNFTFIMDGGGAVLVPGQTTYMESPYDVTLKQWTLVANTSGSLIVSISGASYNSFPIFNLVDNGPSDRPYLSNERKRNDQTISNWPAGGVISSGTILAFTVLSANSISYATLSLKAVKS